MLPQPLLITLPIPALILLILLTTYTLTPFLALRPNIHLSPLLQKLTRIIPGPKRNLPRSFFGLPTRPDGDGERILGVRGKLGMILLGQGMLSLACGWGWLLHPGLGVGEEQGASSALVGISVTALPATILVLSTYSIWNEISHSTLLPRILPLSMIPTTVLAIVCGTIHPNHARIILMVSSSLITAGVLGLSTYGGWRLYMRPDRIRLRSTSPSPSPSPSGFGFDSMGEMVRDREEEGIRGMKDSSSWLTSPSHASQGDNSGFDYSPSNRSVPATYETPKSHITNQSDWLTEPTTTPQSLPEWDYSPSGTTQRGITAPPRSPNPAITRSRSCSPGIPDNLPKPIQPTPKSTTAKGSTSTNYTMGFSTPGSAFHSPGGSIIGAYSPDPVRAPPRGFTSLTSFPMSPDQYQRNRSTSQANDIAFVPNARNSTWTLGTFHSSTTDFQTPAKSRRAPPPPPMPMDMPLPPTPTFARSETLFDWPVGKESSEMLLGIDHREWVEVERGVDGLASWGKGGKGVGVVGMAGVLICYVLNSPLLVAGPTDTNIALFLVATILQSPILALATYLLRYKPPATLRRNKSSTTSAQSAQSATTYRSLALTSESQLSLPVTISPKLTPPQPNRASFETVRGRGSKLLEPKPSISNFGYHPPTRRHTIYGSPSTREEIEDAVARKTLARRSTDVWMENGHAKNRHSVLGRATEMLKPVPALCILENEPREGGDIITRLREGVVSMLPSRLSQLVGSQTQTDEWELNSPIKINIESPSKYERRIRQSEVSVSDAGLEENQEIHIRVAMMARMSGSPSFVYPPRTEVEGEGYELDWLAAGVLPNLVPGISIGSNVRVAPGSDEFKRHSSVPHWTHGRSTSIDYASSFNSSEAIPSTPIASLRNRLRHKKSFSLPEIDAADFEDVRRSVHDCGQNLNADYEGQSGQGEDLPPIPHGLLTPVTEVNESAESTKLRRTFREMTPAILHLTTTPKSTSSHSTRFDFSDLAPIALHGMEDRNSSISSSWGDRSVGTEEEEMCEEMEQVLKMDTPTRASFVTSPPTSDVSRSTSRASTRMGMREDVAPPVPIIGEHYDMLRRMSATTSGSEVESDNHDGRFTDADEQIPPVPGFNYIYPTSSFSAHPHPPPLSHSTSVPNFSRPNRTHNPLAPTSAVITSHPPVPVKTLNKQKSFDTIRSDFTTETATSTDESYVTADVVPEFRPSQQELARVQQLKLRAEAMEPSQQSQRLSTTSQRQDEGVSEKGVRPLRLVSENKGNRVSTPMPLAMGKGSVGSLEKGFAEKGDAASPKKNGLPPTKRPLGLPSPKKMSGRHARGSGSKGSRKENMRVTGQGKMSKVSTGPGMSGLRI